MTDLEYLRAKGNIRHNKVMHIFSYFLCFIKLFICVKT